MRVLLVVDHAISGSGPHRNVVGTLNALSARTDIELTLLTEKIDKSEPYALLNRIQLFLKFKPHSAIHFFSNLFYLFKLSLPNDLVYVPSGLKACLYASFVCRVLRKPIVTGPNVTHFPFRKADSPSNFEVKWLTDLWLEASQKRRDYVRQHVTENLKTKVQNLHHAIDLNKFSPAQRNISVWEQFKISKDSIKILYVGRDNTPLKGVSQILDAIDLISKETFFRNIDFILVGRMSENTTQRAKKYKNIHLLGFQRGENLSQLYASSDISLVPSSWENFPFTVLEALASGLAVIASHTGGIPEMIDNGTNGVLIDIVAADGNHSPQAAVIIAQSIKKLVEDPALRKSLGQTARQTVQIKFSEQQLGENLVGFFRKVAEEYKV